MMSANLTMTGTGKLKQAVILAAGMGVRLRPLTLQVPKPMAPVNGRPFLDYVLRLLKGNGIEEVVFLLGYLPEKITEFVGDGSKFGLSVKYSHGTLEENNGSRVRNAEPLLDQKFLLLYGDIYWPLNLREHLEFYEKMNLPVMMTVYDNHREDGEYKGGNVEVKNGIVTYYDEFRGDLAMKGLDIGYSVIDKSTMKYMPKEDFEFQREFLKPLIADGMVSGFVTDKPYCTITNLDFLKQAEAFLKDLKA